MQECMTDYVPANTELSLSAIETMQFDEVHLNVFSIQVQIDKSRYIMQ